MKRRWPAEVQVLGYGGVSAGARSTGVSGTTARRGLRELREGAPLTPGRGRRFGGGRQPVEAKDLSVCADLELLVEPHSRGRGHPESPLRWTCKGPARVAEELQARGHRVNTPVVARLLNGMKYSLQANRKTREGIDHPDRNARFFLVNARVRAFRRRGQPVVSVDAKKKELMDDFKNAGQEWEPEGRPVAVRSKDFPDKKLGKALPHGVCGIFRNEGWVSVGVSQDTVELAFVALREGWQTMDHRAYPLASELLVTADGGGSRGGRSRLRKVAFQRFADRTGRAVTACHFSLGTSKRNKIQRRKLCHVTENWSAPPIESTETSVNLISIRQQQGLRIRVASTPVRAKRTLFDSLSA